MWTSVTIAGKPADCFLPERRGELNAAILFLHGFKAESLQNHPEMTSEFERWGIPVIAPLIPGCWWLDRVSTAFDPVRTPQEFLRQNVIDWMGAEWGIVPPRIALLGVSTGGQGVLQLAYREALRFPVVSAISPALDFDRIYERGWGVEELFPDAESARQGTAILNLHPLNWPKSQFFCSDPLDQWWHAGADRLHSKLASSGIPHECDLRTSHGGHGWPYFEAMAKTAVDSLVQGLRRIG